ncbi:MAG: hypothetical protein WDA27_00770 [Actinomycetota bacterium]
MTTIRATCPTCGEVELTPDDILLMVCTQAAASYYQFDCPLCSEEVQKPADDRVVQLLISGGVAATVWDLPGEDHPRFQGPPITLDDLLDFHLLLQEPNWFNHFLEVSA